MLDYVSLLSSGLAFFVVAVSPGPATISNAAIAMSQGRRASLVYGAGLSFGLVFWGFIAASGMGAILQSSHYVLVGLKIAGGLYLLWLAFLSGRSAWQNETPDLLATRKQRWFLQGLLLNLSNPKSVFSLMAALSVVIDSDDGLLAIAAATAVCIAVGFFVNALYSLVFSIGGMMRAYQRARRWVDASVSGLFTLAGFGLIKSAWDR